MTAAADVTRRSPRRVFRDRREAGRVLAELLAAYRDQPDVIVLGLARGGLPVAWEVAAALHAPLDAFVVRKLGAPGHDEFAVGALASGGRVVVNDDVVRGLRITPQQLRDIAEREGRELLRRESAYRGERPPTDITGKTVIVVDDGLATGASMFAAVQALRDAQPAQIVIAVPARRSPRAGSSPASSTTLCARPCRPRSWPSVSRFGTSGRSPTRRSAGSWPPRPLGRRCAGPRRQRRPMFCAESRSTPPGVFRRTRCWRSWSAMHESC